MLESGSEGPRGRGGQSMSAWLPPASSQTGWFVNQKTALKLLKVFKYLRLTHAYFYLWHFLVLQFLPLDCKILAQFCKL